MHKFVELITPIGTPLLVFPVSGKSLLCNIIHFSGANLHFHLPPFLRNDSGVERLIAVGLRNGYKVPKTFGDRCVPICDDGVDAPAILFGVRLLQNDADGKKIVYLLKRLLLSLHFPVDGVDMLRPAFDLGDIVLVVELFFDRPHKLFNERFPRFLLLPELAGQKFVRVWIDHLETEILQFILHLEQAESMGQRRIELHRLCSDAELFLSRQMLNRPHVCNRSANLISTTRISSAIERSSFMKVSACLVFLFSKTPIILVRPSIRWATTPPKSSSIISRVTSVSFTVS